MIYKIYDIYFFHILFLCLPFDLCIDVERLQMQYVDCQRFMARNKLNIKRCWIWTTWQKSWLMMVGFSNRLVNWKYIIMFRYILCFFVCVLFVCTWCMDLCHTCSYKINISTYTLLSLPKNVWKTRSAEKNNASIYWYNYIFCCSIANHYILTIDLCYILPINSDASDGYIRNFSHK